MFKNSIKLSLMTALCMSVLFTGCSEDTDEADSHQVQLALDSGDNDKVIELLNNCSAYSGDAKDQCYLDLGAAYFGKANFDMISLAQEFSKIDDSICTNSANTSLCDDEKSKEFNKIIFDKLDDSNLKEGITYYKHIVDENSSICNEADYDGLNKPKKQACLSINPLLLSSIIDDDNTTAKSTQSVSIEQIIDFKDVLKNAVPELQSSDLLSILDGDTLSNEKDRNANNVLDSIEATEFAIKEANGDSLTSMNNEGVTSGAALNTLYTSTDLQNVRYLNITVTGTSGNTSYDRLTQLITGTTKYTTLTTIPDTMCDINNTAVTTGTINGTSILPCVLLKEDGNVTSLNDSVVGILNQPGLIDAIALSVESEDDTKTDTVKIDEFKNDLCNITGTATTANNGLCDVDSSGEITITQAALIDYMQTSK